VTRGSSSHLVTWQQILTITGLVINDNILSHLFIIPMVIHFTSLNLAHLCS